MFSFCDAATGGRSPTRGEATGHPRQATGRHPAEVTLNSQGRRSGPRLERMARIDRN